jgi:hypothetical protein
LSPPTPLVLELLVTPPVPIPPVPPVLLTVVVVVVPVDDVVLVVDDVEPPPPVWPAVDVPVDVVSTLVQSAAAPVASAAVAAKSTTRRTPRGTATAPVGAAGSWAPQNGQRSASRTWRWHVGHGNKVGMITPPAGLECLAPQPLV